MVIHLFGITRVMERSINGKTAVKAPAKECLITAPPFIVTVLPKNVPCHSAHISHYWVWKALGYMSI